MLSIAFHPKAWGDYLSFLDDKKTLKKINTLIKAIARERITTLKIKREIQNSKVE